MSLAAAEAVEAALGRLIERRDATLLGLREVEWYTEALSGLGFADIRVIPGAFDVVVATRP